MIDGWKRMTPCGVHSSLDDQDNSVITEEFIAKEAMQLYTNLSGLYSGKGLFRDSNRAYRMSKKKRAKIQTALSKNGYRRP